MSMEINGRYSQYQTDYAEHLRAEQGKAKETEKEQNDEKASGKIPVPHDEYISSEKSKEKCTGSTDKVDREIRKLKEKKKQLEQQIRSAARDEKKVRELEEKLAQVESELSQKDNDTYRRQHSTFVRNC